MTETRPPTLVWLRRDLRLADNPALAEAAAAGPVLPVFILDPETEATGAAHRLRLSLSLADLSARLRAMGSRLILRRGPALTVLRDLIVESGAKSVRWSRLYDATARARDEAVKAALIADGIDAASRNGALLFEPWTVRTQAGGFHRVYSPYWRAVCERPVATPLPAPARLLAPDRWPPSDHLEDWRMASDMQRGGAVVAARIRAGEPAAQARLEEFLEGAIEDYSALRDRPDLNATSGLSDALAVGEVSPRQLWAAAQPLRERGSHSAAHFLKEIVWREFAHHLLFHTPHIETRCWREEWEAFPWRGDNDDAERWRRGSTGVALVDAAMRELQVTGRMHNRTRMITASFLTKHLLTSWRVGEAWFRDQLIDWDPASNSMGWQWVAGCGPDAAPYFRIFNPDAQASKFDPDGAYRRRFIAELSDEPGRDALDFFDAIPTSWNMSPADIRPTPIISLKRGRERALDSHQAMRAARAA